MRRMMLTGILGIGMTLSLLSLFAGLRVMVYSPQAAFAAPGETYCVIPVGESPGTLLICQQVFTSVQAAVEAAGGGETIRVATGLYTDVHQRGGVTQLVYVDRTLTLRGGYSPDFSAWDATVYPTILDAAQQGRVFYLTGNISVTIEGFEITGGTAPATQGNEHQGGGLYLQGVTATLRHNNIHHNITDLINEDDGLNDAPPSAGGGLYITNSLVYLAHNQLHHNSVVEENSGEVASGSGGSLYASNSQIRLEYNTIHHNIANNGSGGQGSAGGLTIAQSEAYLAHNQIYSNTACIPAERHGCALSPGGGILIDKGSRATLLNNQVLSNTAVISAYGPDYAVAFGGGIAIAGSEASLQDNLIQGNIAAISAAHAFGGGIYFEASTLTLTHNLIARNLANRFGLEGHGGGLAMQAYNETTETITLEDNLILENRGSLTTSTLGGGIHVSAAPGYPNPVAKDRVYMRRNQILSNTASMPEPDALVLSLAGGIFFSGNILTLDGDIIRFNQAQLLGVGLYLENAQATIMNTVIADDLGGVGLFVDGSEVHVSHTTIARNQGPGSIGLGILMGDSQSSSLILTNTIIADQAGGIVGDVGGNHTITVNTILWHNTPITVVDALSSSVSIRGQYVGSPDFLADGYHIGAGSAAIGRGITTSIRTDIEGHPRLGQPDLGADEYVWGQFYLPLIQRND